MISDFREGGRFSKIRESLCKNAFSIGGKSEIGGKGGSNMTSKNRISFMDNPQSILIPNMMNVRIWAFSVFKTIF